MRKRGEALRRGDGEAKRGGQSRYDGIPVGVERHLVRKNVVASAMAHRSGIGGGQFGLRLFRREEDEHRGGSPERNGLPRLIYEALQFEIGEEARHHNRRGFLAYTL